MASATLTPSSLDTAGGWTDESGGSPVATLIDEATASPGTDYIRGTINAAGVLKDDQVNVIIHGHEPQLAEVLAVAAQDPELIAYAKSKGAARNQPGGHFLHGE